MNLNLKRTFFTKLFQSSDFMTKKKVNRSSFLQKAKAFCH